MKELPTIDEAGVIAVEISENLKLEAREQAFFIAGFQEAVKYLMSNEQLANFIRNNAKINQHCICPSCKEDEKAEDVPPPSDCYKCRACDEYKHKTEFVEESTVCKTCAKQLEKLAIIHKDIIEASSVEQSSKPVEGSDIILSCPVKYSLAELFDALKWGRPAKDQLFLSNLAYEFSVQGSLRPVCPKCCERMDEVDNISEPNLKTWMCGCGKEKTK